MKKNEKNPKKQEGFAYITVQIQTRTAAY